MNVDRYIARSGFTSRRKAIVLIAEKRVNVNGKPATLKTLVGEGDIVSIDGTELESRAFVPTYIAYHKPKGSPITSSMPSVIPKPSIRWAGSIRIRRA